MTSPVVIVGGGIAGLLAAVLVRERDASRPTILVEQRHVLGGLLGKIDAGVFGTFDLGMHTMTETGIPELDRLFWSLLPERDWHVFSGKARDISGAFFRGKMQLHTHYPDARALGAELHAKCLGDFFQNLQGASSQDEGLNLLNYADIRFGPMIAREIVDPIVRKTYHLGAEEIALLAAKLLPLDRIALLDERSTLELMASPLLRARVAFPEQRHLDLKYSSGRGSYYPRRFGIHRVIDALETRALTAGVEVLKETSVCSIARVGDRAASVKLGRHGATREITELAHLYWCAGQVPLAIHLGALREDLVFSTPLTTVVVNFLFDAPARMADLYYFYCFDAPHPTYRVTNFSAYCPGAPRAGGFPVCVELLMQPGCATDAESCTSLALAELRGFGVLAATTKTLFASVAVLERGFPVPSVQNMTSMNTVRHDIQSLGLRNLTALGALAEPGLFFQTDVVADVFRKLTVRSYA
jgi:glycine/D-amino acid oxidase-like deaminating enzyme